MKNFIASIILFVLFALLASCSAPAAETTEVPFAATGIPASEAAASAPAEGTEYTLNNETRDSLEFKEDTILTLVGENVLNGKLKAKGNLVIQGSGSLTINSGEEDCINVNGDITIISGTLTLTTDDDAIHSDANLTVNGGTINVLKCYEGIEAEVVTINGGEINIVSSDDGINAAAGTSESAASTDPFGSRGGNSALQVNINGGTVRLYTTSDGIDSNGSVSITGGTVIVYINNSRDGDPIDTDGAATLIPTLFVIRTALSAGVKLSITDSGGNEVFAETLPGDVISLSLTLPELKSGETYTVFADGTLLTTAIASTIVQGGMMQGGGFGGGNRTPPGEGFEPPTDGSFGTPPEDWQSGNRSGRGNMQPPAEPAPEPTP
jgi:hypothetical protein